MLKYFIKRNNFNRIKKLIETKPIHFTITCCLYPQKTINQYFCENIIIKNIINFEQNEEDYAIKLENKKIYLDENQIKILYELAKEKHKKI